MTFRTKARRAGWLLVIAAFAFGIVSAIRPAPTQAYGLISTRYIKLSSSQASATNTIYSVGFTTATASQSIQAIVVHFCSNDPIIGDACVAPTGFASNSATLSINNWAGGTIATAPTVDTTNSNVNAVVLKWAAAQAVTSTQSITFDLGNGSANGLTNPSAVNSTFFARITLYSTIPTWAAPTGSPLTDPAAGTDANYEKSTATDAGGVAMSTALALNVTAKVQEQLTFCVYTGANCAAGGNTVTLGDSNGVLSSTSTVYLDSSSKFDLASNALSGVSVRLKGNTLTSGSNSIAAAGTACTADPTVTTTSFFGTRVVTYGAGQVRPAVGKYDCLAGNHMLDPTVTNTTYGDPFVITSGATNVSTSNLELAAKASTTTPAGVYTSTLQLIATGTY